MENKVDTWRYTENKEMKNKELIEVYRCCRGEELVSINKISEDILESEIDIKRFCEIAKSCASIDKDKVLYTGLRYIFDKKKYGWKDEEVRELLGIAERLLLGYRDYFGYFLGGMYETKLIDLIKELETVNKLERLKILSPMMIISLSGIDYDVKYQSFEGMVLCKLNGDTKVIENIGAILFKDGNYNIEFVHNRKDFKQVLEKVERFDYDMVMLCHSITERLWEKNKGKRIKNI